MSSTSRNPRRFRPDSARQRDVRPAPRRTSTRSAVIRAALSEG